MTYYNPENSNMSTSTLCDFLRMPLTGNLNEIPGLGKSNIKLLGYGSNDYDKIKNSFQLIGVFLTLKHSKDNELIDAQIHANLCKQYLKNKGLTGNLDTIVNSILEKINTMIPGMYDCE